MSSELLTTPAGIIRQLMIDLSLGTDDGVWRIYSGYQPDEVTDSICVYDTSGTIQGRTQFDGVTQGQDGIQVSVRANVANVGYLKAKAITTAFDTQVLRTLVTVDAGIYKIQAITLKSGINSLGREAPPTRRRIYTANFITSLARIN